jgi:glyoxylase-like metal-dependent hydrolase (beta-lactamase superfamily II)
MDGQPGHMSRAARTGSREPAVESVGMPNDLLSRRVFLADLGRGAAAVAVFGLTGAIVDACGPANSSPIAAPSGQPTSPSRPPSGAPSSVGPSPSTPPGSAAAGGGPLAPGGTAWRRVNLGFVSAYLLIRDGEGAIVDTGVAGSEDAIHAAMTELGLDWSDIGNVILTHRHADHAGSINPILAAAPEAVGSIGAADLSGVATDRPLTAVSDGDEVFGLQIVGTPGHTAGHISVFDEVGGILVAGDALGTVGGPLAGSNPQFTADAGAAQASIVKLGKLRFETLLVGHGEPILTGASAQVAALGAG